MNQVVHVLPARVSRTKMVPARDRLRRIVHKQIKNDAGVIMSTAENGLELSVKISVNTKTQISHVVLSEGNKVPG